MNNKFISSYRGEAHYDINGKRFSQRYFANDDGYYNGNFQSEILPLVGCVRYCNYPEFHTFPPPAVMAEFHGYVAARFKDTYEVEYEHEPAVTVEKRGNVWAKEHWDMVNAL